MSDKSRHVSLIGHSIVNGLGVLTFGALHIWGSMTADTAGLAIGAICGLWGIATRKGPPSVPPGAAGLIVSAAGSMFPKAMM